MTTPIGPSNKNVELQYRVVTPENPSLQVSQRTMLVETTNKEHIKTTLADQYPYRYPPPSYTGHSAPTLTNSSVKPNRFGTIHWPMSKLEMGLRSGSLVTCTGIGAGIGAGIGSLAGGIGAVPGALIGAAFGLAVGGIINLATLCSRSKERRDQSPQQQQQQHQPVHRHQLQQSRRTPTNDDTESNWAECYSQSSSNNTEFHPIDLNKELRQNLLLNQHSEEKHLFAYPDSNDDEDISEDGQHTPGSHITQRSQDKDQDDVITRQGALSDSSDASEFSDSR